MEARPYGHCSVCKEAFFEKRDLEVHLNASGHRGGRREARESSVMAAQWKTAGGVGHARPQVREFANEGDANKMDCERGLGFVSLPSI